MSKNKTLRATVAFARDDAHEMAFAKALETLGVNLIQLSNLGSCITNQTTF